MGMAATVNPCGFALLPAYLSVFVGLDDRGSKAGAVGRALGVSAVMTAGFVTVFGLFGAVITKFIQGIEDQLPWATMIIGIGLVLMGIYLLTGRQILVNLPKLQRGGSDGTMLSMYLFGMSYAIASLTCTITPFLAVTTSTFRSENYLSGVAVFIVYGLGMGIIVGVLTVAVALARNGLVAKFRAALPYMNRVAGVLLVIAGAYVAYYGYYEVRVFGGYGGDDPIIDVALDVQKWMQDFIPTRDNAVWFAVGAGLLIAAALGWSKFRGGHSDGPDESDDSDDSEMNSSADLELTSG